MFVLFVLLVVTAAHGHLSVINVPPNCLFSYVEVQL